ncbi:MAG: sulfatase [Thermoanaerobaculia bacterium]
MATCVRPSGTRSPCTLAILLTLAACGDPSPPPPSLSTPTAAPGTVVRHDLVQEFDAAEVRREIAFFDLGAPEVRIHLIRGWGNDERDGDQTFVWGLAAGSDLDFFVSAPKDLTLVLDCQAFGFEGAPPQTVTVTLGGRELSQVTLGRGFARYRMPVPADALRRGVNRLRFDYRVHHRPRDVLPGAQDERPLAVQWDSIELRGLESAGDPRLASSEDRIEIPRGSRVAYYFELEPDQELVIGDLAVLGRRDDLRLLVEVTTEDGTAEHLLDPDTPPPLRVPLAMTSTAVGRLALTAVAAGKRGWLDGWFGRGESGLSLLLPMVMSTAAEESADGPAAVAEQPPPARRPDVLLYVIDTLRADHLGVYGYERSTSPAIDRFARDAVLFRNARAQSSWTRTAMVSVMTGLLPQVHGVNRRDDALNRRLETLAEMLKRGGYETAGFVTNGNLSASFGLGQGFDFYRYLAESRESFEFHQLSDRIHRGIIPWLETRANLGERPPFFLYAHSTDPHAPYTPRQPFRGRFAAGVDPEIGGIDHVLDISANRKPAAPGVEDDFIDLYDGEIAFNDHQFGRLVERLKKIGLYDSTLIVLISDHGEEFREHGGWEHGKTLYGEQLRIPLIVKLPGGASAGREIDSVADQIDVLPTILDAVGLESPDGVDGHSLLPLLASPVGGGLAFSEPSFAYLRLEEKRMRSIAAGGWKLILDDSAFRRGGAVELYRTLDDPFESRELRDLRALELGFLEQSLRAFESTLRRGSRRSAAEPAEVSAELRRRLKALGYVN